jgi:hypothetical protein
MKFVFVCSGVVAATALVSPRPHYRSKDYKRDCGKRLPVYGHNLLQTNKNPGAGMQPDKIVPYETVLKDGFLRVGCFKDAMYHYGDKFGDNKFEYKMEDVSNSSIVHYTDIVPKEDREKMTPNVCFEFCRGIPDMSFFGISNGRDCYCETYFKKMAGDSSTCDSVCEGDPTQMCGGAKKNSIWDMHMCDQTEENLAKAIEVGVATEHHLEDVCSQMEDVTHSTSEVAQSMQKMFGLAGDPGASNQMQDANVRAGKWLKKAEDCLREAATLKLLIEDAEAQEGKDYSDFDNRKAAETAIKRLTKASEEGEKHLATISDEWHESVQPREGDAVHHTNQFLPKILSQYYSVMYFVDDEYADDEKYPVTCEGEMIGDPIFGYHPGMCAAACDDHVGECVGFAAYDHEHGDHVGNMCFLFSKIEQVQYYTGCAVEEELIQLRGKQVVHKEKIISGFHTLKERQVNITFTQGAKARSTAKRESEACANARAATKKEGPTPETCYLKPNNDWLPEDLPGYFNCLQYCNEDFDPNVIFDGLTCSDIFGFYGYPGTDKADICENPLEVRHAPEGSMIKTVCPLSCETGDAEVIEIKEKKGPLAATPTAKPVVIEPTKSPPKVPHVDPLKAMCRAKLSLFSGINIKPDPSGKNSYALKELTKADRCFE